MGKLNIAHHKSYHPYRRDNIERVRRDEEEAQLKEAKEEGRLMLADSEARMDLLRSRAGLSNRNNNKNKRERDDEEPSSSKSASIHTSNGHINFFEDLEQNAVTSAVRASKKAASTETDKGVALAPSTKDLNPWYSNKNRPQGVFDDEDEGRRKRDSARKSIHDPLTSITKQLASSSSSKPAPRKPQRRPSSTSNSEVDARLSRESSERERALALIRRKKQEMMGSATPSTVHGGLDNASEYGDMYNRREVEEAHRIRERRWDDSHSRKSWGGEGGRRR
ncbi:hypothetical protein PM082_001996 [Marasmius tenuissimus]|nr:hypothetical protein PM082_001996 [Marasmius tenuissimus]